MFFRLANHRTRHAGECGDLQAEAARGRPRSDRVQEHQFLLAAAVVIGHLEMRVTAGRPVLGKLRELEVMGREQGIGLIVPGKPLGHRARQCEAVVGRGAAPDFVEQDERAIGGVMQDLRGLAHLHHERALAGRQIVARADTREDAIQRADARGLGRHEAADMREQHDQRGLAHIGGLAAHVRAGDQQQAAVVVQFGVVGDERRVGKALHDGMPAAGDLDARRVGQRGRDPVIVERAAAERAEHVQTGQPGRDGLQFGQMRGERLDEFGVECLFAGQRPLAGREHLILELLEFRRDIAFDGLEGLATLVIHRRLVGMHAAHLDVIAVHAVVADLERFHARTFALARFQFGKKTVGIGRKVAQFIQRVVVAARDYAAVANHHGRVVDHRALEQGVDVFGRVDLLVQGSQQRGVQACQRPADRRQRGERAGQPGQIARARGGERDAGGDTFDIRDFLEPFRQPGMTARQQRFDRQMAMTQNVEVA